MGRDDDRTVIGGPLPTGGGGSDPFGRRGAKPADERTRIGAALPGQGARTAPTSAFGRGGGQDTWVGGPVPPGAAPGGFAPPQSGTGLGTDRGFGTGLGGSPGGYDAPGSQIGRPAGAEAQGFFPQTPDRGPRETVPTGPRLSLEEALRAGGTGAGGFTNPLVAAAADLLILFGRLRTGMVEMRAAPLMEHVLHQIETFESRALQAGVAPQEVQVAKYALCGTADDIVQNLPGADRSEWAQYSMAARFFGTRDTGVGFFHEAEKAMQAPAQYFHLLELMLTCLSLGFEGEYRTRPGGATELARIRHAIYETLRRVRPRPDEDVSPRWTPVILRGKRRFGGIPVWAFAAIAAVILVGFYATLSTLLGKDGWAAADTLYTLHPTGTIALERSEAAQPFIAESTQLDRIRAALAPEIGAETVDVGRKGEFIYVRVGNALLFESGEAEVAGEFAPLALRIAEVLNDEDGPVRVLGFTDNDQPTGRGQFKTNLDLSVARAEAVHKVLAPLMSDPGRLSVEGRGEADPIADNATLEGRALNRRVEVMVAREGTF